MLALTKVATSDKSVKFFQDLTYQELLKSVDQKIKRWTFFSVTRCILSTIADGCFLQPRLRVAE